MRAGIGRFILLSVLAHAGLLLAWQSHRDAPEIRHAGGTPLQIALQAPPVAVPRPATGEPPAARPVAGPDSPRPAVQDGQGSRKAVSDRRRAGDRPGARPEREEGTISGTPDSAERATHATASGTRAAAPDETRVTTQEPAARAAPAPLSDSEVTERVRAAAATHFYYPPLAQRRGWEGRVRVGLHISADGRLTGIRLLESSGYRVLDQAAVRSLERVAGLPGIDDRLRSGRDIELPIEYRLVDA